MMSKDLIVSVVGLLLSSGLIASLLQIKASRYKVPIEKDQAAIAVMESNMNAAILIRDVAIKDYNETRARLDKQEEVQEAIIGDIKVLKGLFDTAVVHIRELWKWIEDGSKPPAPVLPIELHNLVDLPTLRNFTEHEDENENS